MTDTARTIMLSNSIQDILKVFAEQEIGCNIDVNEKALADYLDSTRGISDYFEANTKEEMYEVFLTQVLDGYPIWQLLELPEWTKSTLEREFQAELDAQKKKAEKEFACLRCKHYRCKETPCGSIQTCHGFSFKTKRNAKMYYSVRFKPRKTKCKDFEERE